MERHAGKPRCRWANPNNPRYLQYHDQEWGVPVYDDAKLFEMLILENFQAGLSWECVLNKWEAFRRAFDGFGPGAVCAYDDTQGCTVIRIDTYAHNHPAKLFYEKNGFRIAGYGEILLQGLIQEEQVYLECSIKRR